MFGDQCLLYKSEHNKFIFTRNRVGSRADRVSSFNINDADWNQDFNKFLKGSQEADNKSLMSREGRKLQIGEYMRKMQCQLYKHDPKNHPVNLLSGYVPPQEKKHSQVI